MRKKFFFTTLIIVLFSSHLLFAAGGVILKENFVIEEDPDHYYFKSPSNPVINEDGYLIVSDENQILVFDPERKFVGNIYKAGEGPGEIKGLAGIWPGKYTIFVFSKSPGKMILFNYQADFLKEIFLPRNLYKSTFLNFFNNKFYFTEEEYRNTQKGIAVMNTIVRLFSFDMNGNFQGYNKVQFPKKYYLGPRTVMNMHFIQYGTDNSGRFYLANNGSYELKYFDLMKDEIKPLLRGTYTRVPIKNEWRKFTHPRTHGDRKKYIRNFLDDILRIRVYKDKIWLFTSKFNEKNIVNVDVYSKNGEYQGSMEFPMPGSLHLVKLSYLPLTFNGDDLLIFVNDEYKGLHLACYKILNIPPMAR